MKKLISAFLCVALMFSLISNPTSAQIITNEAHAIFGEDSRVEANSVNTFPNSASAFVTAAFPNGKSYIGSGVFVGATSVLTAAHVIYSHDDGGWATAVTVTPGGVDSSYSSIPGISLAIATGWSESRDFDYDYGMIRIAQNPGITWFGLRPFADNELAGQSIIRYAFDGDKPRGTLWIDRNSAIVGVTPRSLHHHAASYRGSSGGAIVLADHPTLLAGIHVASSSIDGVPVYNRAVRVTLEIMDFVNRNRSACDTAGHRLSDWETVSVATCTSQGAQTSRCLDCGLRESSTQSAFGHNMGEWERVFEPTCTRDGLQMRRCSLCPFAESDFIERGHIWSDWRYSLPPTLQSPGIRRRDCGKCGEFESHEVPPLIPAFSKGDVNGNGVIDISDALAILRRIIGLPSVIDDNENALKAALITPQSQNSGTPSINDALAILRRIIGLPNAIDGS